jgi:hypothetical protein
MNIYPVGDFKSGNGVPAEKAKAEKEKGFLFCILQE